MPDKPARSRRKPAEPKRSPGERLREAVLSVYLLNPAEAVLLDQACAIADTLARLNAELASTPALTGRGAKGNLVASPLLLAQRRHAEVLARVLDGLALPDVDQDQGEDSRTRHARKAALARWSK